MASSFLNRALPVAALLSLAALAVPSPAQAQNLLFTLSGATFNDGATAVGSFVLNPTTRIFNTFNITTSNGNTGLTGTNYTPSSAVAFNPAANQGLYIFDNREGNYLLLETPSPLTTPGTYALVPGILFSESFGDSGESTPSFGNNGEFINRPRVITSGSLIVTNVAAAAPEPGSIALLLTAGIPALGLVRRRRK